MNILLECGIPSVHELVGAEVMISLRECFADGLSRLLRDRDLTQAEFARKIEVTPTSVSRWLNAKELPTANTLDKIAAFFKIHPANLFAPAGHAFPAGPGKITLDLEKIAAESGFKLTPKDS